jgi:hypothetical protein
MPFNHLYVLLHLLPRNKPLLQPGQKISEADLYQCLPAIIQNKNISWQDVREIGNKFGYWNEAAMNPNFDITFIEKRQDINWADSMIWEHPKCPTKFLLENLRKNPTTILTCLQLKYIPDVEYILNSYIRCELCFELNKHITAEHLIKYSQHFNKDGVLSGNTHNILPYHLPILKEHGIDLPPYSLAHNPKLSFADAWRISEGYGNKWDWTTYLSRADVSEKEVEAVYSVCGESIVFAASSKLLSIEFCINFIFPRAGSLRRVFSMYICSNPNLTWKDVKANPQIGWGNLSILADNPFDQYNAAITIQRRFRHRRLGRKRIILTNLLLTIKIFFNCPLDIVKVIVRFVI